MDNKAVSAKPEDGFICRNGFIHSHIISTFAGPMLNRPQYTETHRLESLQSYELLDTPMEEEFDELAKLASEICGTPVALITLLDQNRQWFKSSIGTDLKETLIEHAFCAHTVKTNENYMIVKDTREDHRFINNPLVTGKPNIIFYAGVTLMTKQGHPLGTLCVIDQKPNELSPFQLQALQVLARQVMTQIELRKKITDLEKSNRLLLETNTFIQNFASTAAHDLKNPLSSMLATTQMLKMSLAKLNEEKLTKIVDMNLSSSRRLLGIVDDMLEYSKDPASLLSKQQPIVLNEMLKRLVEMIHIPEGTTVLIPEQEDVIICPLIALEQIFLNLLSNAIRYADKESTQIKIEFQQDELQYKFSIADNGIGIAPEKIDSIFNRHVTLESEDRFKKKGTGIGLSTVKTLIEKLQGKISVSSTPGIGSTFEFSIKKQV